MTKRKLVCAYATNCELLDELSEENEELKSENQYLKSLKWNRDCINEISIGMQQRQSLEISNNKLVKENEQLKTVINRYEKYSNKKNDELNFRQLDILKLKEENEQLKQRNDRQAKQLDRLYQLIREKDWRTLTDIMGDFKRCEEQLQKEWGTYGDVE